MKLRYRNFGDADDVREVPFGRLETYDMGEMRIGRSTLQPGWRWSESIKPIARTELCEFHHIGLCVSGSCRIRMREGAELLIEAGQFYEVPPGHDAWVVGDEPWVTIDWYPSTAFARPEGGGFDRVVATLRILGDARAALRLADRLHRPRAPQAEGPVRAASRVPRRAGRLTARSPATEVGVIGRRAPRQRIDHIARGTPSP